MLKILKNHYPDPQAELVEACRRGERQAQYEIYKAYSEAMFNLSMRMVNNSSDAEDILQESFLDAFRKIDTFKGESTFGAWLKRIVINRSINYLKKKKIDWVDLGDRDFVDPVAESSSGPDASYKIRQVHRAIQDLPDGFRSVLSLYLLEGYDHREISQILEISESTSKSQYNRAKKKLALIIKQQEDHAK